MRGHILEGGTLGKRVTEKRAPATKQAAETPEGGRQRPRMTTPHATAGRRAEAEAQPNATAGRCLGKRATAHRHEPCAPLRAGDLSTRKLARDDEGGEQKTLDVLDRVQQRLDALGHRRWNALRPEIRPMPPARLLMTAVWTAWRGRRPRRGAAGVDQADAAHVAVRHLPAAQVDRVVAPTASRRPAAGLAEADGGVAAVVQSAASA
jgi:hypothetical protein